MVTTGFRTTLVLNGTEQREPVVLVSKVKLGQDGEYEVWGYTWFSPELGVEFCTKLRQIEGCDCAFCIPELVEV